MDLDEVERETAVFGIPEDAEDAWREYGPGLIAELRASRELIAQYEAPHCSSNCPCARSTAWRAYAAARA